MSRETEEVVVQCYMVPVEPGGFVARKLECW